MGTTFLLFKKGAKNLFSITNPRQSNKIMNFIRKYAFLLYVKNTNKTCFTISFSNNYGRFSYVSMILKMHQVLQDKCIRLLHDVKISLRKNEFKSIKIMFTV